MKQLYQKIALSAVGLVVASTIVLAGPQHTGIQGRAFLVRGTPGELIGVDPFDPPTPIVTTFSILSARTRREVARISTDASGFYSVSLPPDRYILMPDVMTEPCPFWDCGASTVPIEVTVQLKQRAHANIFYFRHFCRTNSWTPVQVSDGEWRLFTAVPPAKLQNFVSATATVSGESTMPELPSSANQGHHQSGIAGWIEGMLIVLSTTCEFRVVPYRVRVYRDSFPHELVAETESKVKAHDGRLQQYFEVNLKPGSYFVVAHIPPAPEDGGRLFTYPVNVTVEKKAFTEIALSIVPVVVPTGINAPPIGR